MGLGKDGRREGRTGGRGGRKERWRPQVTLLKRAPQPPLLGNGMPREMGSRLPPLQPCSLASSRGGDAMVMMGKGGRAATTAAYLTDLERRKRMVAGKWARLICKRERERERTG